MTELLNMYQLSHCRGLKVSETSVPKFSFFGVISKHPVQNRIWILCSVSLLSVFGAGRGAKDMCYTFVSKLNEVFFVLLEDMQQKNEGCSKINMYIAVYIISIPQNRGILFFVNSNFG